MSQYIALYRKFRPNTFFDVVGQEHIVKILQHQIINNQIGHAYLFCGSRGTGKTTTAKIFSRAVNCLNIKDGEPCNECDICKGILNSSVTDVLEIDAASNNGVEDIRSIRENVIYAPAMAKYKVYIIDEVHMLSTSAFNALLKTLEEPPQNVIFILATTEPHKIPITILSRCQRFEFKRISNLDIEKRLEFVCDKNEVKYEKNALMVVAGAAEGALRDALSLLDRIISSGIKEITEEKVREILGISEVSQTVEILEAILSNNIANMISIVQSVVESGKDIKYFVWEIISLARDVLVYKTTENEKLLNNFAVTDSIKNMSETTDTTKLNNVILELSELEANVKGATFPNILLEATLIELMTNTGVKRQVKADTNVAYEDVKVKSEQPKLIENKEIKNNVEEKVTSTKPVNTSGGWINIINHLRTSGKMALYASLVSTKAEIADDKITIYFNQEFGKNVIEKSENMSALKNSVMAIVGKDLPIKCVVNGVEEKSEKSSAENSLINSGIDVNIL